MQDYYEILQVSRNAEPEVIKAAYRNLSFKYHPDRNRESSAQRRMRLLNEAYEILSDPDRRRDYDARVGHNRRHHEEAKEAHDAHDAGVAISFTCPACGAVTDTTVADPETVELSQCGRCGQQVRLRRASDPAGAGLHILSPDLAPLAHDGRLQRLRELHEPRHLPGDFYCYVGMPVLFLLCQTFVILLSLASAAPVGVRVAAGVVVVLFFVGIGAALVVLRNRENRRHLEQIEPVRLKYELTERLAGQYRDLVAVFRQLVPIHIWDGHYSAKGLTKGSALSIRYELPQWLEANVSVCVMQFDDERCYFLPEAVLTMRGREIEAVPYPTISMTLGEERVYEGEEVIGHRWLHPTVDGGPDRRYAVNYQIPIYQSVFRVHPALKVTTRAGSRILLAESHDPLVRLKTQIDRWRSELEMAA